MKECAKTISTTKPGAVLVLNPWDSQGNQIADGDGIYPTIRTITWDHQNRITDYTAIVLASPHPPTVDMPLDLERSEPAVET